MAPARRSDRARGLPVFRLAPGRGGRLHDVLVQRAPRPPSPHDTASPTLAGDALPKEYEATFPFTALKRLRQPWFHPWGDARTTDRRDVWFVREDGSNLDEVVADARDVIATSGLRQLAAYRDPRYAYCALFDYARRWPPRAIDVDIEVFPCGAYGSPRWHHVIEILAPHIGRDAAADRRAGLPTDLLDEVLGP